MRLLSLAIFNIDGHSNQRINRNIMHASLQMQLQVLSFIAKKLTLLNNNANLFG